MFVLPYTFNIRELKKSPLMYAASVLQYWDLIIKYYV